MDLVRNALTQTAIRVYGQKQVAFIVEIKSHLFGSEPFLRVELEQFIQHVESLLLCAWELIPPSNALRLGKHFPAHVCIFSCERLASGNIFLKG
jgi:hypothetical protein